MSEEKKVTEKRLCISMVDKYGNYRKYVSGNTVEELVDGLIVTNDASFVDWFIKQGYDYTLTPKQLNALSNIIENSKKIQYVCDFVNYVEGANIEKLQDAVIATNNAPYIYTFARDIQGANIEKLQDAVIATNNAEDIYDFAKDIKGANVRKLWKVIKTTKDLRWKKYFKNYFNIWW